MTPQVDDHRGWDLVYGEVLEPLLVAFPADLHEAVTYRSANTRPCRLA